MRERPHLVTERLDLRPPEIGDIRPMYDIVSHPETQRFLGPPDDFPAHFTRVQRNAGSWFLSGYGIFIVRERDSGTVIGNCGIFHTWRGLGEDMDNGPEAGWIIGVDHAGKGYAREAMEAVIAWFEETHGAQRITAMIEPGNAASFALAERLGFKEFRRAELDGCEVVLLERLLGRSDD